MQTKTVKMRTLAAGPEGTYQPGQIVGCSPETAKQFVDGGYADFCTEGGILLGDGGKAPKTEKPKDEDKKGDGGKAPKTEK